MVGLETTATPTSVRILNQNGQDEVAVQRTEVIVAIVEVVIVINQFISVSMVFLRPAPLYPLA